MATKKTKQFTKSKKPVAPAKKANVFTRVWEFAKDNPALAFLIVVLICGVIYGSIYLFERWQFSTAEKKLDSIATALVTELGEPTSIEKNKSCSYRSTVFEDQRGLPSCGVSYVLKYANDIRAEDIDKAIDEVLGVRIGNFSKSEYPYPTNNLDLVIDYKYIYNLVNCSASVDIVNNQSINKNIDELDSKNRIYLYCGKHSTINKPYPVI